MSVAKPLGAAQRVFRLNRQLVCLAGLFTLLVFAAHSNAIGQDNFIFEADNGGSPFAPHGFGAVSNSRQPGPDILGAEGQGDYSLYLSSFSLVTPEKDLSGLWTVFRVTQVMCRALYRGEKNLVEAAPKGFVIARDDIHSLGFERPGWNGESFAVTRTGDSERDAAGGHPFWNVSYDDAGRLESCAVELVSMTQEADAAGQDPENDAAVRFLYVGMPQIFFGIITEPVMAGVHPPGPGDAITVMAPCGGAWCQISTLYQFSLERWYVSSRIGFGNPLGLEQMP